MSLFLRSLTLMLLILSKAPAYAAISQETDQQQEEFRETKDQLSTKQFRHSLNDLYGIKSVNYPVMQPHNDFDTLYAHANAAQQELERYCNHAALLSGTRTQFSGIKSRQRALQKVNAELAGQANRITDLARGSIIADDINGIVKAYKVLKRETEIVKVKNRFKQPKASGYRDLNLLVKLPQSGVIAEVQLHLTTIAEIKSGPEHRLYENIQQIKRTAIKQERPLTNLELTKIATLQRQSSVLYYDAWQPYLTTHIAA